MPPVAIAGAAAVGVGMAANAYANYRSNKMQSDAAAKAAEQQAQLAREQMANMAAAAEGGQRLVGYAGNRAADDLRNYYGRASSDISRGYGDARSEYERAIGRAQGDITKNYGSAISSINAGYDTAANRLSPLANLSRYGEMAVSTPIGSNFETDPGYQFRLAQGNDALGKATAAAGGRLSGAALKKLTEYNQGFASNEFNNAAQRDLAMRNMQMQLGQVGYNATGNLAGMDVSRGANLGNLYMSRGGAMSALDQDFGRYAADLETAKATSLANYNVGLGTGLSNIGMQTGNTQADLLMRGAGGQAGVAQNMLAPTYSATVPYAGGGWRSIGQLGSGVASIGSMMLGYGMMGGGGGGGVGGGVGGGGLPSDAQYISAGSGGNLNQVYGTPYAPPGYYKTW